MHGTTRRAATNAETASTRWRTSCHLSGELWIKQITDTRWAASENIHQCNIIVDHADFPRLNALHEVNNNRHYVADSQPCLWSTLRLNRNTRILERASKCLLYLSSTTGPFIVLAADLHTTLQFHNPTKNISVWGCNLPSKWETRIIHRRTATRIASLHCQHVPSLFIWHVGDFVKGHESP